MFTNHTHPLISYPKFVLIHFGFLLNRTRPRSRQSLAFAHHDWVDWRMETPSYDNNARGFSTFDDYLMSCQLRVNSEQLWMGMESVSAVNRKPRYVWFWRKCLLLILLFPQQHRFDWTVIFFLLSPSLWKLSPYTWLVGTGLWLSMAEWLLTTEPLH